MRDAEEDLFEKRPVILKCLLEKSFIEELQLTRKLFSKRSAMLYSTSV